MNNIDENIKRLSFTFSKGNKPNQEDIKAFNGVVEWINTYKTNVLNNNQLFAKLYILMLKDFIDKFETDIFDPLPQKELSRILDYPLESFYKSFTNSLNDNHRFRLLKDKGETFGQTPSEFKSTATDVSLEDFKDAWNIEEVRDNLDIMIVEALKRFS